MTPVSITVSGTREKVLTRLQVVRASTVSLSDQGHSIFQIFQDYVGSLPSGSQVTLMINVMCHYSIPPAAAQPRQVGA